MRKGIPKLFRNPIPAIQASLNLAHVVVAQARIEGRQSRHVPVRDASVFASLEPCTIARQRVIVRELRFVIAALQTAGVKSLPRWMRFRTRTRSNVTL